MKNISVELICTKCGDKRLKSLNQLGATSNRVLPVCVVCAGSVKLNTRKLNNATKQNLDEKQQLVRDLGELKNANDV